MVIYSVQKEIFVNYTLSSVSLVAPVADMMDGLKHLSDINEFAKTIPELANYKEKKVSESGTKITFYLDGNVVVRYKIVKHVIEYSYGK